VSGPARPVGPGGPGGPGGQGAVAVIGAGVMGAGIAQVFAAAGRTASVFDPDADARRRLPDRVAAGCAVVGTDPGETLASVSVHDTMAAACAGATLVIEAAPERLDLKRMIFAELERVSDPAAVLASNTSSIPIRLIAEGLADPGRVIGTHFWSPPSLVPLVEVVQAPASSPAAVASTVELLAAVGLKPLHVAADVPGCVGNRLQHALKREAIALVAAGVCTAETLDAVVRHGFGRRLALMGPLEQADLGGLDLTLAIHDVVMPDLDVTPVPHPYLVAMVARGDLGAKTGQGFYSWAPGRAEERRAEIARGLLRQL
jgi:3-hydroxybutyryl-CoA dehydrogenase